MRSPPGWLQVRVPHEWSLELVPRKRLQVRSLCSHPGHSAVKNTAGAFATYSSTGHGDKLASGHRCHVSGHWSSRFGFERRQDAPYRSPFDRPAGRTAVLVRAKWSPAAAAEAACFVCACWSWCSERGGSHVRSTPRKLVKLTGKKYLSSLLKVWATTHDAKCEQVCRA